MALTTQATVSPTQILDSAADISSYDFSGDYIAYVNSAPSGSYSTDVMLYNWKTSTSQSIFNSSQVAGSRIDGNYVLFQDRDTPATSDLVVYNINSGSFTTIDTFSAFFEMHMDIGDGYVIYEDYDNVASTDFVRIKTITGTEVWSHNVTGDSVYGFNIDSGYAMFSGAAGVYVYNTVSDSFFTINQANDVFMTDYADTDGTTIIFTEGGSYPNEFLRLVTYNIDTKAKSTIAIPITASQFRIDNGKIYYTDSDQLYWMDIDGTNVEQISDTVLQSGYLIVEDGLAVVKHSSDWSILQMYDTAGMDSGSSGGGTTTTGNVIGTTGGTITRSGAVLDIPAGSLAEDVEFSMDKLTVDNDNVLSAFKILPNDITFDPAAELTIDIPSTTRAEGNELMRLEDGQWVAQESTPSSSGTSLIAQITQTGTYAVTVARDTVDQAIDTAGGVISLPDVSLDIPADALSGLTDVSIEEVFVDTANVAQAVAVDIGGAILGIPAHLNFDIPAGVDSATAQVGQLVGNSWIEVSSTVNSAGQLVADITEGGIYALITTTSGSGSILPGIPFPGGMSILAVMLSAGLAVAVVRGKKYRK